MRKSICSLIIGIFIFSGLAIAENKAPEAVLKITPPEVLLGHPFFYEGYGHDPDGEITGCLITFPDGTTDFDPHRVTGKCILQTLGEHCITLTVRDNWGAEDSTEHYVRVFREPPTIKLAFTEVILDKYIKKGEEKYKVTIKWGPKKPCSHGYWVVYKVAYTPAEIKEYGYTKRFEPLVPYQEFFGGQEHSLTDRKVAKSTIVFYEFRWFYMTQYEGSYGPIRVKIPKD